MSNTKTEAQRLADRTTPYHGPHAQAMASELLRLDAIEANAVAELRRLNAIEQRYIEMMANPCPEWDGKAYMQAIASLRAQLAKAVAEEREACAKVCDGMANKAIDGSPMQLGLDLAADAIRARSNT